MKTPINNRNLCKLIYFVFAFFAQPFRLWRGHNEIAATLPFCVISAIAPYIEYIKIRLETFHLIMHGTIIRAGITCKKIPCYMRNSACSWFSVEKAKNFEDMLNIFEFSRMWENAESWLVYANKLFWIAQPYFSTNIIKQS